MVCPVLQEKIDNECTNAVRLFENDKKLDEYAL